MITLEDIKNDAMQKDLNLNRLLSFKSYPASALFQDRNFIQSYCGIYITPT